MPDQEDSKINSGTPNTEAPELEDVGIREYLSYYFPDLEKEKLDAYEYIEQNCPEKLFPPLAQDEEIPIEKYTAIHSRIHKEMTKQILSKSWDVLVEKSGMFGGKTSSSFDLADKLERMGYSVKICIADVMGEDFITGRSYQDGPKERKADRYGKMFPKIELPPKEYFVRDEKGKLRKVHNEKRVVILDEFSFLDNESIKRFVQKCREENVKVILTGLDKNYLGETLAPFENLHSIIGNYKEVECKSFVPGLDDDEPTGDSTIRYINIGGKQIIDLGILPLVVSKEEENKYGKKIVTYAACRKEMTAKYIFANLPHLWKHISDHSNKNEVKQGKRLDHLQSM